MIVEIFPEQSGPAQDAGDRSQYGIDKPVHDRNPGLSNRQSPQRFTPNADRQPRLSMNDFVAARCFRIIAVKVILFDLDAPSYFAASRDRRDAVTTPKPPVFSGRGGC
jgi:hypothetical protein